MPNHFHFVVEIRGDVILPEKKRCSIPQFVSKQFSNLFSSYAQSFNRQQNRRGDLFMSQFRRQPIDDDSYLTNVIRYVHLNHELHGFVNDFSQWEYSSYQALCSNEATFLARDKVMRWFGNVSEFRMFHQTIDRPPDISFLWLTSRKFGWVARPLRATGGVSALGDRSNFREVEQLWE